MYCEGSTFFKGDYLRGKMRGEWIVLPGKENKNPVKLLDPIRQDIKLISIYNMINKSQQFSYSNNIFRQALINNSTLYYESPKTSRKK